MGNIFRKKSKTNDEVVETSEAGAVEAKVSNDKNAHVVVAHKNMEESRQTRSEAGGIDTRGRIRAVRVQLDSFCSHRAYRTKRRGMHEDDVPISCTRISRGCAVFYGQNKAQLLQERFHICTQRLCSRGLQKSRSVDNPFLLSPEQFDLLYERGFVVTPNESRASSKETLASSDGTSHFERRVVFRDLWFKGFYVRSGAKFGGNFLLYTDDPDRTHGPFVVNIVASDTCFEMSDFVRFGRMFTATQKRTLLAVVRADTPASTSHADADSSSKDNADCLQSKLGSVADVNVEYYELSIF